MNRIIFLVMTLVSAPVWAHKGEHPVALAPSSAAAPKADAAKPDTIEAVEATADTDDAKPVEFTFGEVYSRLHPALVHAPIAWLVLVLLIELIALYFKRSVLDAAGFYLLALTALSFGPAITSGLLRLRHLANEPGIDAPALVHRNIMFGVLACVLVALGLRWILRHNFRGAGRYGYVALLVLAVALVTIGGHRGAKLVFGDDYLPF